MKDNNAVADDILSALVNAVEGTDLTPGVTLTVNGFVISGLLISSESYLSYLNSELGYGISDSRALSSLSSAIAKASSKGFLHLKDAKISSGSASLPSSAGVLWRGRLSDVNGFTLGVF